NKLLFFYTGVLLFILAVFPYNAVRRIPELYDGNSRHQLLIPLGFSLILIYGTKIFIPFNKIQKPVYSLFIAAFVLTNVHFYAEFQVDWFKQASLIENFKKSDIIRGNTTFLFDDKTEDLNASKRTFRFYEYTELMKLAFGDETRFGQRKQDFETIEKMKRYTKTHYNIKDYEWAEPRYIVEIHSRQRFGKKELVKLKILELFKESKFREEIREYIALKYQKLT
ncbi:MAG: hypothetical protein PHP01_08540, partial [Phycisphaerae bacterium]|nr:hypothetical protein [Phycisphaerae bacterium]